MANRRERRINSPTIIANEIRAKQVGTQINAPLTPGGSDAPKARMIGLTTVAGGITGALFGIVGARMLSGHAVKIVEVTGLLGLALLVVLWLFGPLLKKTVLSTLGPKQSGQVIRIAMYCATFLIALSILCYLVIQILAAIAKVPQASGR